MVFKLLTEAFAVSLTGTGRRQEAPGELLGEESLNVLRKESDCLGFYDTFYISDKQQHLVFVKWHH